ncbi:hypothetical protein ABKN59_001867 [Abortiporus biennis]
MSTLLELPSELRLLIYEFYLFAHLQSKVSQQLQPSNEHFRLLRVCHQIRREAADVLHRYVSLHHERQILAFSKNPPSWLSKVTHADVANDGRFLHTSVDSDELQKYPLSQLHLALAKLPSLTHLRIFECRQGLPISLHGLKSLRFSIQFEDAMFPPNSTSTNPHLSSYELFLRTGPTIYVFNSNLPTQSINTLRLSGECHLARKTLDVPALQHLALDGVTGNYFDRHTFDECFPNSSLRSFRYNLGIRTGFEIRNKHLESLVNGPGRRLNTLVLLGCHRLSSSAIAQCLRDLTELRYFALSLITVEEMQSNFLACLPTSVSILKLHVTNAWYAVPLLDEERMLCDTIEHDLLVRNPPLQSMRLNIRSQLTILDGRQKKWEQMALGQRLDIHFGPWEKDEYI